MKMFIRLICTMLLALVVLPAFAGRYQPGTVTVCSYCNPGQIYIIGAYNVRYNPNANSSGYIATNVSPSLVQFFGQDSTTGESFSCQLTPSNSLYAQALDIAMSPTNGSIISAYRTTTSAICTSVGVGTKSYQLD
jgi:hypothetical protein